MVELVIKVRQWPMVEIKGERVPGITNHITLKTIPLLLIGNPQLHPRLTLKADDLLINCNEYSRHPHVLCLLV
jgi:hypothetical protein